MTPTVGKNNDSVRTFISLNPDHVVLGQLGKMQNTVRKALSAVTPAMDGIRWTEPLQIHLTVKFLGSISPTDADWVESILRETVAETGLPTLAIADIGCFPVIRNPRVIWCGVRPNPQLNQLHGLLNARLAERLPLENEGEYYPHLTLARIKPAHAMQRDNYRFTTTLQQLCNDMQGAIIPWKVQSAFLMKSVTRSSGPAHTILADTSTQAESKSSRPDPSTDHSPTLF